MYATFWYRVWRNLTKYFLSYDRSATTGAFAAGVLLAGNRYRAQIKADVRPFEGRFCYYIVLFAHLQITLHSSLFHPGFRRPRYSLGNFLYDGRCQFGSFGCH